MRTKKSPGANPARVTNRAVENLSPPSLLPPDYDYECTITLEEWRRLNDR